MDLTTYSASAKSSGDAGVVKHGSGTLLVKVPGGFDPATGAKKPPIEIGLQREDIVKMRDAAAVQLADQVATLQAHLDALNTLLTDADAELAKK